MEQFSLTQRQDTQRRAIVDLGIALQAREGTMPAVEFLRARNIAAAVIQRVLAGPERRRAPAVS